MLTLLDAAFPHLLAARLVWPRHERRGEAAELDDRARRDLGLPPRPYDPLEPQLRWR